MNSIMDLIRPELFELSALEFENMGASYEQTWKMFTSICYIPNIKAVGLSLSEKKILKCVFFVPMLRFVTPRAGPVLTQGASYEQT